MKRIDRMMLRAAATAACAFAASLALAQSPTQGITKDTIRIGMFAPLTGSTAVGSLPLLGAEAIYKDVNARGGIHGRKIEMVIEDDACDPNKAIAAVKKLIAQDQVFMIHGGWCSNDVLAIKPELAAVPDMPFMALGAANSAISVPVQPNIFQPVATTNTVARAMVDFSMTKPATKRIAIISHSDEWGKSHLEPAMAQMKSLGLAPVETVYFERGGVDATSQILRIRDAKPDVVLAILYPAELTVYLREAYKYGIKVPTIATQGVSVEDMVKRVGMPAATKQLFVFYPLADTLDGAGYRKWIDLYKKYNAGEPVETLSFMGMTGALAVVQALDKAGPNLTRENFTAELNKVQNFDPGLQSGPLTFSPQQHSGIQSGKMIYMPGDKPIVVTKFPG